MHSFAGSRIGVSILAAIVLSGVGVVTAQAAAPAQRILTHTYGGGSRPVLITLIAGLPDGPVRIFSTSPSARPRRRVSPAEFNQWWNVLVTSGAQQLQVTGPAKTVDDVNNYHFSLAEIPSRTGHQFVVPKTLLVPIRNASPAVAAVARRIRALF